MEHESVLDGDGNGKHPQLRDALTEGYNPIPNFFISARIPNKSLEEANSCPLMTEN